MGTICSISYDYLFRRFRFNALQYFVFCICIPHKRCGSHKIINSFRDKQRCPVQYGLFFYTPTTKHVFVGELSRKQCSENIMEVRR
ncbi:hypothetical protein PVAP13_6KG063135 [Panicum virgatum]|nr:hypothetical protein PVAP13_6KG063135 [Panicum virgatum]